MRRLSFALGLLVTALVWSAAPAHAQDRQSAQGNGTAAAATAPVNLNTATPAQLEKLPGIGVATAARIIEYREKNGPFKKVEELMNVRGIGEKVFLKLKPLVTVTAAPAGGQP
jgi:competence protein ComEA